MMNLLKYEFRKFIYSKKNAVVFIALITLLIGFIGYNNHLDQQYPSTMEKKLWDIAESSNKTAKSIDISMRNLEEGERKENLKEQKQFWLNLYDSSLILVNGYTYDNYQSIDFVQSELKWNKLVLQGMNQGYNLENVSKENAKTIQEQIAMNQYIIDNAVDIPHSPFETSFFNLFNLIFKGYFILIITFLFLLLVFDISTVEFENGSYKVMYSSKDSIAKIILAKTKFMLILVTLYVLLIVLVFAITGLFFGFGSPSYPYPIDSSIFQIVDIVILMLILFFEALIVLSGIVLFISYVTYSSSVTMVAIVTSYMMIIVFQKMFDFQSLYPYIPLCYPFVKDIIQAYGVSLCISIGTVCFIILIAVCVRYMKKKDILI